MIMNLPQQQHNQNKIVLFSSSLVDLWTYEPEKTHHTYGRYEKIPFGRMESACYLFSIREKKTLVVLLYL